MIGTSETWVEVMKKKKILVKNHQPRFRGEKKKDLVLIPAAAFEVVYSHDNESVRAIHSFFKNLLT